MGSVVTVADCRAEGIEAEDSRIEETIEWAEAWLELETGFRFYQHHAEYTLDGKVDPVLHLPQPIISIQSVEESGVALTSTQYAVYDRRPPDADDRRDPRLVRKPTTSNFDVSGRLVTETYWAKGIQNIVVEGEFGYTDSVGGAEEAPPEIRRALLRLVASEVARVGSDDELQAQRARKWATSVSGEGLSVSLSQLAASGGPSGIAEVDTVVARYRHPRKARRAPFAFGGGA